MGLLTTLLIAALITAVAMRACRSLTAELDPAERLGVAGLIGLGAVGVAIFFVGLVPGGFRFLPILVAAALVGGLIWARPELTRSAFRLGLPLWLVGPAGVMGLIPIANALAPCDPLDWDTLAYHLAVPKIWLAAGQMTDVSFIHQSFFPFAVDNLFVLGLATGGETGAKTFTLAAFVLGFLAIFGLVRRRAGSLGASVATVAYLGSPLILWESGSGYIDVVHGLYAGLGLVYALEFAFGESPLRSRLWLAAGLLGFALASKHTGLPMLLVAGVLVVAGLIRQRRAREIPTTLIAAALAIAIAAPWYARSTVLTGNPVYPFFSEVFPSRNWDPWRAAVYREEQLTFGVGRGGSAIGHAMLGVAYQPGRFVNPGQTLGLGSPLGAIGFALPLLGFVGAALGMRRREDRALLAGILLFMLVWFLLSQQSRYLTGLVAPLALAGGLAATTLTRARFLLGAGVAQGLYSLWMFGVSPVAGADPLLASRLRVGLGGESRETYLTRRSAFWPASQAIDRQVRGGKVALFDEVFGFWLDVPYEWANPGHPTRIPYATLDDGPAFAQALRDLGFTHAYVNLQYQPPEFLPRWLAAMGLGDVPQPLSPEEVAALDADLRTKWKRLLAEATAAGEMSHVQSFRSGLLLAIESK